jgi:hypothetical protein
MLRLGGLLGAGHFRVRDRGDGHSAAARTSRRIRRSPPRSCATAFYSSPFEDATILVCDRSGNPELTVWRGDRSGHHAGGVSRGRDPGFASRLYAVGRGRWVLDATGRAPDGMRWRASASGVARRRFRRFTYDGDRLAIPSHFQASIASLIDETVRPRRSVNARASRIRSSGRSANCCAPSSRRSGGVSSALGCALAEGCSTTAISRRSWRSRVLYTDVFVPANPGNAGVAVGAALAVAAHEGPLPRREPMSPFLGPEFSPQEIKAVLDNCKLSYDYLRTGPGHRPHDGRPCQGPAGGLVPGADGVGPLGRSAIAAFSPARWRRTSSRT